MFVGNVTLDTKWQKIDLVDDGMEYLIQNVNQPVQFIVTDTVPDDKVTGGILPSNTQLDFKKVSGSLYMKNYMENDYPVLYIEGVE